ncbi:hypothetical protein [Halopseudomonas salina]|uniref:MFS transporter n=1 Tax=Halopseudomonas salina TaxID=1323744 RepID=A0ABQ1P4M5_9GAMM|nr:hypothetical protein [Halopseudomonas salina]GGC90201.1 hypothetical protein GCM10007418_07440 [Halopseudomonas salina]
MPALLIISGLLLIVLGWLWVAVAARKLPIGRLLLAILAAPLTLIMRGRGYARTPRLLMLSGLLLVLAGAALLQREQPERFAQLLAGEWATPTNKGAGIEGELMGQPFNPERIFWRGNDLIMEEGPPQRIRRALTVRFDPATLQAGLRTIDRLPGDTGPWPELLLQWHTGALTQPGLLRVTEDYTLSLDLIPLPGEAVQLGLRLHLPTKPATLLNGEARLTATPDWLARLQQPAAVPAPASQPELTITRPLQDVQNSPQWQDVSVLAVLDEPEFFIGQQLRLTTQAGRRYEGRLKAVSDDRRIVLAQNSGANQVDYHFRPTDVAQLQVQYRSSR